MYCRFCGKEMGEGEVICVYCGKNQKDQPSTKKLYGYEFTKLKATKEQKSPGVAAALGFCFGWILLGPVGYIYLGQWNWFWLTFVIQIVAPLLTLGIAYFLLPIIFAIHQYQMAKELNEIAEPDRETDAAAAEAGGTETAEEP